MKRILIFLLLIPFFGSAQMKISEMPTYSGNPNGGYVPVVINNTNRKVNALYFGFTKMDSISVSQGTTYDTLHSWKNGAKAFYKLVRVGSGGGSLAWTDITGKPSGSTSQYFRGDFSLATFPTIPSTTSQISEGSNLYFTTARARAAMAADYGVVYDVSTGKYRIDSALLNSLYTTELSFGSGFSYNAGVVSLNPGNRKVIPDANYTIVDSVDTYIILPDPVATRTLTLPAATNKSRPKTIYCGATTSGEWILSGSFTQNTTVGTNFTENFTNSGLGSAQLIHLVPILDGSTWRWFDLK